MTSYATDTTVRDLATAIPGATRLFEQMGIDYCCGGARPLADVCEERGLDPAVVVGRLNELAEAAGSSGAANPETFPMARLVDHLVSTHHVYTRSEIVRLEKLFEKVCFVHGANHPELHRARAVFQEMAADLMPHMMKEENILFPYIIQIAAFTARDAMPPSPMFGSVQNPVRMMLFEHEAVGALLAKMRELTKGYTVPEGVCISYETLYEALLAFEQDLHQHIHLENNVLFPQAIEAERHTAR